MAQREYTADSNDDRHQQPSAPYENNRSYVASSEGPLGLSPAAAMNSVPSLGRTTAYQAVSNTIDMLRNTASTSMKIGLAEIGFIKQLRDHGGVARSNPDKEQSGGTLALVNKRSDSYTSSPMGINRQDTEYEFVFRCGDYFLPISFDYSVRAQKTVARSQLVDGAEILQQTFKQPKIVNVSIRLERDLTRIDTYSQASTMSFINAQVEGIETNDRVLYDVMGLGAALDDLYENNDIFRIEHKTLNNDLNMDWVYMEDYEFSTTPGSTIIDIRMTLREVDMNENTIAFIETTIISDSSAGRR